jgi:hypothetical protein
MKNNHATKTLALVFCAFLLFLPALLYSQINFYTDKSITIVRDAAAAVRETWL